MIDLTLFQAVPGPGKYDVRGVFDAEAPKVNTEGIEVEHPPFGSQAKVSLSKTLLRFNIPYSYKCTFYLPFPAMFLILSLPNAKTGHLPLSAH